MDRDLSAHPVHVMATFHAQQPRHRRQRTRGDGAAVVFIGGDVAVLAERAAHVAGGEEDRARAPRAAIDQLFPQMMKVRGYARVGAELTRAEVGSLSTVYPAVVTAEITVREHSVRK